MSVRPVAFPDANNVAVVHDELGHAGTVGLLAAFGFAPNPDGTQNHRLITLTCPAAGCGAVSLHPVAGGADADMLQRLFVRRLMAPAANLPPALVTALGAQGLNPPLTWAQARGVVKALVIAMENADRWRLENVPMGG